MKRLILSLSFLGLLAAGASVSQASRSLPVDEDTVYICNSPNAYAYHRNRGCAGLNRCTHGISSVSKSTAQSKGRSACKKCY